MGISRRSFIKAGLCGGLGALWNRGTLCAGTLSSLDLKEARFYHSIGAGKVRCRLCGNSCEIPSGETGTCGCRLNLDGRLFTLTYNRPVAIHRDPIEKLPFHHVLPGTDVLCVGTAGCNLSCLYCINHQISQKSPNEVEHLFRSPEDLVATTLAHGLKAVAFSYNEPTVAYEYMFDTFEIARKHGLKTFFHTNGSMTRDPLQAIVPITDAIVVDFKAYSPSAVKSLTGRNDLGVGPFLKTAHEGNCFLEIVNLVVPGMNDDRSELEGICRFIESELSVDVPVQFSRCFPKHRLSDIAPTPSGTIRTAVALARRSNLRYAYSGNLQDEASNTSCPHCGNLLIKRHSARAWKVGLGGGRCAACGLGIPGVWEA